MHTQNQTKYQQSTHSRKDATSLSRVGDVNTFYIFATRFHLLISKYSKAPRGESARQNDITISNRIRLVASLISHA
jgi:hypothetical protein